MSDQDPTVKIGDFGYVDMAPTVTRATVQLSVNEKRVTLRLDPGSVSVSLPHDTWVQLIPVLIEAMPEPARSQAIAAVAQLGVESVTA